ncbi:MAG: glycosyltransferase [Acidobacteriota bacterium]|nr:glycosyltransferase [Acidobacteriota bacterium]
MTVRVSRIAVLTADVGEGHLAAARTLAEDIRTIAPEVEVTLVDALEALGPVLRSVLRDAYRFQLRRSPWIFHGLFWLFHHVRPLRALGRAFLAALGSRGLRARLEALNPDIVVSTYPAATSVLGSLRRRGRLSVPALATITDFAGVSFWAHSGIDLHLVMQRSLVPLVEREAGPASACVVAPLAGRAFGEASVTRAAAREELGLAGAGRIVVVSGGGWGVGDIAGAVVEAATLPGTTVVAVSGRNDALEAKLAAAYDGDERVRVLGFTDAMPSLLAAADVVVHTTGGVTCLEALKIGCPIVAYGAPAGHSPALARAMGKLGIAVHAKNRADLRAALRSPRDAPVVDATASAADHVLQARMRTSPATRRSPLAVASALVASGAIAFLLAGSRTAFAVISQPFELAPATVLPTEQNAVGLVIVVPPADVPRLVRVLERRHAAASFAFPRPTRSLARLLAAAHDETMVSLRPSGVDDWLGTADAVKDGRTARFVLAPRGGMSAGQYLLARLFGAHLVAPSDRLEAGAVVLWSGGSLARELNVIARHGLRPSTVGALIGGAVSNASAGSLADAASSYRAVP